jgi:hypothetical protein
MLKEKLESIREEIIPNLLSIKHEIKRLMRDGAALRENIKNLKWAEKEADKMYEIYRPNIRTLEHRKESAAIYRNLRKRLLNPNSGISRNILWQKKKEIGVRARHLQLLYAMLRGKQHSKLEHYNSESNSPSIPIFMELLQEFVPNIKLINIVDVIGWLELPESIMVSYITEAIAKSLRVAFNDYIGINNNEFSMNELKKTAKDVLFEYISFPYSFDSPAITEDSLKLK